MHKPIKVQFAYQSVAATLVFMSLLCGDVKAYAETVGWHPLVDEKLPTAYIAEVVERDFKRSSLSLRLDLLQVGLSKQFEKLQRLHQAIKSVHQAVKPASPQLKQQINQPDSDQILTQEQTDQLLLRHQFLQAKSFYLDLLQEQQMLRKQALIIRRNWYGQLLHASESSTHTADYVQQILTEKLMASPDLPVNLGKDSPAYAEYKTNITTIDALKQGIVKLQPILGAQSPDRRIYIKELIHRLETQLVLLGQERVVLDHMTKLVLLDARLLEQEVYTADTSMIARQLTKTEPLQTGPLPTEPSQTKPLQAEFLQSEHIPTGPTGNSDIVPMVRPLSEVAKLFLE